MNSTRRFKLVGILAALCWALWLTGCEEPVETTENTTALECHDISAEIAEQCGEHGDPCGVWVTHVDRCSCDTEWMRCAMGVRMDADPHLVELAAFNVSGSDWWGSCEETPEEWEGWCL